MGAWKQSLSGFLIYLLLISFFGKFLIIMLHSIFKSYHNLFKLCNNLLPRDNDKTRIKFSCTDCWDELLRHLSSDFSDVTWCFFPCILQCVVCLLKLLVTGSSNMFILEYVQWNTPCFIIIKNKGMPLSQNTQGWIDMMYIFYTSDSRPNHLQTPKELRRKGGGEPQPARMSRAS